jgi:hypothetical protein
MRQDCDEQYLISLERFIGRRSRQMETQWLVISIASSFAKEGFANLPGHPQENGSYSAESNRRTRVQTAYYEGEGARREFLVSRARLAYEKGTIESSKLRRATERHSDPQSCLSRSPQ